MNKQEQIMAYCRQFRTTGIANELMDMIRTAEQQSTGYLEFTLNLLRAEAEHRQKNATQRRRKAAQLPTNCHLKHYDFSFRSEEHTSELQSRGHLVCRLLLEKKKTNKKQVQN